MAEELEGRLYELANHTQRVEDMVREVAHLQNTANSSPFRVSASAILSQRLCSMLTCSAPY